MLTLLLGIIISQGFAVHTAASSSYRSPISRRSSAKIASRLPFLRHSTRLPIPRSSKECPNVMRVVDVEVADPTAVRKR